MSSQSLIVGAKLRYFTHTKTKWASEMTDWDSLTLIENEAPCLCDSVTPLRSCAWMKVVYYSWSTLSSARHLSGSRFGVNGVRTIAYCSIPFGVEILVLTGYVPSTNQSCQPSNQSLYVCIIHSIMLKVLEYIRSANVPMVNWHCVINACLICLTWLCCSAVCMHACSRRMH